jgi:hypothetical protein
MEYKLSEKATKFIAGIWVGIVSVLSLAIFAGVIGVFILAAKFFWFGATF